MLKLDKSHLVLSIIHQFQIHDSHKSYQLLNFSAFLSILEVIFSFSSLLETEITETKRLNGKNRIGKKKKKPLLRKFYDMFIKCNVLITEFYQTVLMYFHYNFMKMGVHYGL